MSDFNENGKIWFRGELVNWPDARIHVMSHVLHYGSSVFEGLRCYNTSSGPAVFRLGDHIRRLFDSAKIYRMVIPHSQEVIEQACIDVVKANGLDEAYLRPIVFRGYDSLGIDPRNCPIEVAVGAWPWGKYLGKESLSSGVDVRISSWSRMRANTLPALSKSGANYMNSQLVNMEAKLDGYAEGIALDPNGLVSEGSGMNVFMVRDGKILTPPFSSSILPGLTRDCTMRIAAELGYEVREIAMPREALYIADEVFFTGSAVEITPIRSIDRIIIGQGSRGPITEKIQQRFYGILSGELEDEYGWLTFI